MSVSCIFTKDPALGLLRRQPTLAAGPGRTLSIATGPARKAKPVTEIEATPSASGAAHGIRSAAAAQPSEPREVTPRLSKRNQGHALLFRAGNFASLCVLGCHPSVVVADALVPDKAGSERLPRGLCNGNGVVERGVPALFRSRRLTQRVHPRGRQMLPWINTSILFDSTTCARALR